MDLLKLVITFLQVGAVSFGGGYSVIKAIAHYVVDLNKWLTLDEFNEIVAISQTTPGPIGINTATYVGFKIGGVFGAFLATLSVILIPVILSVSVYRFYLKKSDSALISTMLNKLRPVVVAMIASASFGFLKVAFGTSFGILATILSFVLLLFFRVDTVALMLVFGLFSFLFSR
ncbi:chromate transporter [Fervidobacterium thailandense]|uniref:Chromate transporter n=1 Tax=Fervidobacterium thailandense TaxID=1008305 RepID=A0A1E3G396_9BACT|nr:chromate transporter [Fervidobacterium thailandense]ODN30303.1 chromate transporter [Fervidobacterium thailandense]